MAITRVTCENGHVFTGLDAGGPCAVCGSVKRFVEVSASDDLVTTTVERHAEDSEATATDTATHAVEVRMTPLPGEDERWLVQVYRRRELIETGIGDNLPYALLDIIHKLVPPVHPDYDASEM